MIRRKFRKRKSVPKKRACSWCLEKKTPDFKEFELLRKFISERGKILARSKTGVCSKDQRRLTVAIKRARHLAFLPFVARL